MIDRTGLLITGCALLLGPAPARAESLCLAPGSFGVNATVDCDTETPTEWPNGWRGYATDEAELCERDDCQPPPTIDCYCLGHSYAWIISASDTSPDENVGPWVDTLYLWLCTDFEGMQVAAFALEGSLDVLAFEPLNGYENLGSADDLYLSAPPDCPGSGLVGRITVATSTSTQPSEWSTWGRTKSAYRGTDALPSD
ncbi:hypothetical protein K8I85_06095 [bacterium]|nr:hypothetical protein [bacterium]